MDRSHEFQKLFLAVLIHKEKRQERPACPCANHADAMCDLQLIKVRGRRLEGRTGEATHSFLLRVPRGPGLQLEEGGLAWKVGATS